MKRLLLTGGCGYVGSHVLYFLLERGGLERGGYECTVYDNLSTGHKEVLNKEALNNVKLVSGDVGDKNKLEDLLSGELFDAVLHFAGFIEAGESMEKPAKYFNNNVHKPIVLLEAMRKYGPKTLLFSSTAAVYGNPSQLPIQEGCEIIPTNPYGLTKYMFEELLRIYESAYGFRTVSLRYFNAAGAHESGEIGEDHNPESHLIPLICQAALGKRDTVYIYGTDYPTFDGTCIRDYIHVSDLALAHLLALESLLDGRSGRVYNLGNGKGYSVKEVIAAVKNAAGIDFPVIESHKRPGDPVALVASYEKAAKELGWTPKRSLKEIVTSAWKWHLSHPDGYGGIKKASVEVSGLSQASDRSPPPAVGSRQAALCDAQDV